MNKKTNSIQRELKNRIRVSTSIDKELYDKFEHLSSNTMIPKSKLFDKAIELVLKEMSNQ